MATKRTVLVTGANGYIAARTVEAFLQAGHSVRGTVRSLRSATEVKEALAQYGDKLEFAVVPDITAEGAFDEAIKGIDAVAHLASPVSFDLTDPEPVIHSATNGTIRVLESALKEPKVKDFVLMSSVMAMLQPYTEPHTYTEADWNVAAEEAVVKLGKSTPGHIIYAASKVAAERAFWKFRDEHKPGFTFTAINPCFVTGPPLITPATPSKISMSNVLIPDVFSGKPLASSGIQASSAYVDIRDITRLVVFGIEHGDKTDGERFLAAAHWAPAQSVADILREEYPERKGIIEEGTPGEGYYPGYKFPSVGGLDGTKAVRVTGEEYIPWRKTVVDTAESLKSILV
ncbi:uncharacterized protein C8A04DRAFT_14690 [Dichotomopilus funicola]|uniref:NAD-dependent epimerase/dehydratase domain-containing protein n=1 Tax=Dichotomopilus funicola TaxID=1934379 RepID=A0AAN6ZIP6_9PEZI|nr:hypothetical protein C8A04DRAFT_14690 [Dichotomopilus funicola]